LEHLKQFIFDGKVLLKVFRKLGPNFVHFA
jgi:hypothetical protein